MSLFSAATNVARRTVLDVHGDTLTYTPAGGAAVSFTGVVGDPAGLGEEVPGVLLVVSAPATEFASEPEKNDWITVGGIEYRIFDKRSESGWLTLSLRK